MRSALQTAHKYDLGIIAAGVLAFIFSLFPYYTASFTGFGGGSANAWHGFFGWFGALLALAGAVLVALPLLGVKLGIPIRLAAVGAFAAALLCTILALFIIPGKVSCSGIALCNGIDYGHGVGYWLALIAIIGGLALCVMRMNATD